MQRANIVLAVVLLNIFLLTCSAQHRIFGGSYAEIEHFPWQILILVNGKPACGGSIVADYFILTAAHCVDTLNGVTGLQIKYGTKTPLQNSSGVIVNVSRYIIHSGYTSSNFDNPSNNDVAILQLQNPIIFSTSAKAIALRTKEAKANEEVLLSGFGVTLNAETAQPSAYLLAVNTAILDRKECFKRLLGRFPSYANNMICTHEPFKSACKGDSGGAVVVRGRQVGIISSGKLLSCGDYYLPELHMNVAKYRSFIDIATQNRVTWEDD